MARRLRIAHVIPLLFAVILVAPSWAYTILNHFPAPVGGPPLHFVEGLAWGNDVLWYSNSEAIFQLDPVTGAELSQTVVTGYINDLAWVNGELWGARVAPAEIVRFDPTDLSVLGTFSTGAAGVPEGLTFDGTSVWFSVDGPPARVHEMDPATGTLLSSRPSVAADPEALGYGDGFLWEGGKDEATIYKVDPATGATIASFNPPTSDVHGLEWDGQYLWASSYANRRIYQFDVSDVNARPTIAYLGTAGYESDGVNPDSGNSSTWFDFRVRYTDLENDAPWYVLVQVYRAGLPVTGSPFLMHDMGDTNTTGGADFQYRTRLPAGPGYTYNFRAANAFGTATGLATADHPGPAVSDQPPVLTWTGEPGYTADGVEPGVGPAGAPFVFRVTYSGTLAAERVRLHILRASQEITNSPFNMTTTDDTPYDGAIYTFQRKLSRSRDYTYYFEASNGNQNATGLPTTQSQGPVVGNRAPTLDFAGTPGYETDGVHPNVGSPEAPFVFKVVYRDEDNDEAITPRLHVTRSGTALPNSPFALTRATAAQPHSQKGVLYSAHVSLARGSAYQYWFSAADPYTPAVGPATGPQDGPVVNSAPVLEWLSKGFYMHDGIHPDTGTGLTTCDFRVLYRDLEGDAPQSVNVELRKDGVPLPNSPFLMVLFRGTNMARGVEYQRVLDLAPGRYTCRFRALDAFSDARGVPTHWKVGPVIEGAASVQIAALAATPAARGVSLTFSLSAAATVEVQVRNLAGRPVAALRPTDCAAGLNTLSWDGRNVTGLPAPGGTYLLTVVARNESGVESHAVAQAVLRR